MYDAFWKSSDYVRANIVLVDEEFNERTENFKGTSLATPTYHLAQTFYISGRTKLKMIPLPEEVISGLQLAAEELQELAEANKKRLRTMLYKEEPLLIRPGLRRTYGR